MLYFPYFSYSPLYVHSGVAVTCGSQTTPLEEVPIGRYLSTVVGIYFVHKILIGNDINSLVLTPGP